MLGGKGRITDIYCKATNYYRFVSAILRARYSEDTLTLTLNVMLTLTLII